MRYFNMINSVDARRLLMVEQARMDKRIFMSGKYFIIRHDVDDRFDVAMKFAEKEYQNNLRTTYFLLNTAPYFDYSSEFARKCKELMDMGHEVGIHYGAPLKLDKDSIFESLRRPIEFLRDNSIHVYGVAAHGDYQTRKVLGMVAYQIWKECPPSLVKNTRIDSAIEKISLADLGLLYEAYFLHHDYYLSDSGRRWNNYPSRLIPEFNRRSAGVLHMLIHPQWWDMEDLEDL
jgi:hypothetical protein